MDLINLAVFLFFSHLTVISGWRTCLLPAETSPLSRAITPDLINTLQCRELNREGLISAAMQYNPLLVFGTLSPKDLTPLNVVPLRSDLFLVKAIRPVRRRKRRALFDTPRYDFKPGQNTYVVSTFALNPTLLMNKSHTQRFSVFAKLTEGVLQEYYEKYGAKNASGKVSDPNSQIYTENLFNTVVSGVGKLRGDKGDSSLRKIKAKSFDEIMKEFESDSLQNEEDSQDSEEKGRLKEAELLPPPKAMLHDDSGVMHDFGGNVTSKLRLINGSSYLLTDPAVLERVITSREIFKRMVPRVMLLPMIILEDGSVSEYTKFSGFRTFVLFMPRLSSVHESRPEQIENASVLGGEALRRASLVLSELNGHLTPYPLT